MSGLLRLLRNEIVSMCRSRRRLLVIGSVLVGSSIVCALMGSEVLEKEGFHLDDPVRAALRSISSAGMDRFMILMTRLGSAAVVVPAGIVVLAILLKTSADRRAIFWILSLSGAAAMNYFAKIAFFRDRPSDWPALATESTFSFPSGHSSLSMAMSLAIVILVWSTRWKVMAISIGCSSTLIVGISRVYLGVHYPSDVVAGWAESAGWISLLALMMRLPSGERTGIGPT